MNKIGLKKNHDNNLIKICFIFFSCICLALVSSITHSTRADNQNQTISHTQKEKNQSLIVQETFYRSNVNLKKERIERIFPIFEFKNGTWISLQQEQAATQNKDAEHQALQKENLSSLTDFLAWIKDKPVNLSKAYFIKETSYTGWEGKKEVKIFSTLKIGNKSETWKPAQPESDLLKILAQDFLNLCPGISYPWDLKDIKVKEAYVSSNGKWLIGLAMNPEKAKLTPESDGVVEDNEFSTHWFAVIDNHPNFLGLHLYPFLAADFLNNSKTTWLMAYAGYNREGYILWDENFKNKYTFLYTFH